MVRPVRTSNIWAFFILLHRPSHSTKLGSVLVLLFPPLSDLFPFPTTTTS